MSDSPTPTAELREAIARLSTLCSKSDRSMGVNPAARQIRADIGAVLDHLTLLDKSREGVVGWKLVPVEPRARHIADWVVYAVNHEPTAEDLAFTGAVIELLPPTGHPDARATIADMIRDYRAMLATAPHPPADQGWLPIESAPTAAGRERPTYSRFLIQFGSEGCAIGYYDEYYAEGGHGCTDGFAWIEPFSGEPLNLHFTDPPTFFRPLPPPPVGGAS